MPSVPSSFRRDRVDSKPRFLLFLCTQNKDTVQHQFPPLSIFSGEMGQVLSNTSYYLHASEKQAEMEKNALLSVAFLGEM